MESVLETNCCKIRFFGALRDMQYSGAAHPSLYFKYHQFYRQEMILWYVKSTELNWYVKSTIEFTFFSLSLCHVNDFNSCAGTGQNIFGFY